MAIKNNLTLEGIDEEIKRLSVQKSLFLDKSLRSKDVDSIIKAQSYLVKQQKEKKKGSLKSYVYAPDGELFSGQGFRTTVKNVTFEVERRMAKTPVINSIITTRLEQISRFLKFTSDEQKEGWTIKKNIGRFGTKDDYKINDKDKEIIDNIATFLENGGLNKKWDNECPDFDEFAKMVMRDSLSLDAMTFEVGRNNLFEPYAFKPTDAGTIRLIESLATDKEKYPYEEKFGYLPAYCQVYNNNILKNKLTGEDIVFYPFDLAYGIRNRTSDMRANGYGIGELEILMEIVTWLLWGMQYNGNFFKQGSNPKGFFSLEDSSDQTMLNEFRSGWRDMMMGVHNSWKIPVFEGGKVNWTSMQLNNKDMEFARWNEFLMVIACSVYKIDPAELGFRMEFQADAFGQKGEKERMNYSLDKGLKPLLSFFAKWVNKMIVTELNPGYLFSFTGIDLEDESKILENDIKKGSAGYVALEDMFKKYSGRELDKEKDTILNQVYQTAKQASQYGGQQSNQAVNEMTGDESGIKNPFEDYEKGNTSNLILNEASRYVNLLKGNE